MPARFRDAFEMDLAQGTLRQAATEARPRRHAPPLSRLVPGFQAPPVAGPVVPVVRRVRATAESVRPQFEWACEEAVAVGTIVHGELERLGRHGLPASALERRPKQWADLLTRLGLPAARHDSALERIGRAVDTLARSATAAMLLDPRASEAASELGLTAWLDGGFLSVKIDRTFVDREGCRWIVDWKSGTHEGAETERFSWDRCRRS